MQTLRALLIDDEPASLNRLGILLGHYCPDIVEVVGECQTVEEAHLAIETHTPDLIFLDVQLGSKTGFDLLGGIPLITFDIIFSTASEHHALRAFQVDAVDYLTKPIDGDKLKKAVGKVLARSPQSRIEHHGRLTEAVEKQQHEIRRIGLPMSNGRTFVKLEDIYYFKSDRGYTRVFGRKGELMGMASETLGDFQKALEDSRFYRIHDSHMINMEHVKSYINGRGGIAVLADGTELNVSEQRKAGFLHRLKSGRF
jgi:two-component system, LytTR family, response regulator